MKNKDQTIVPHSAPSKRTLSNDELYDLLRREAKRRQDEKNRPEDEHARFIVSRIARRLETGKFTVHERPADTRVFMMVPVRHRPKTATITHFVKQDLNLEVYEVEYFLLWLAIEISLTKYRD